MNINNVILSVVASYDEVATMIGSMVKTLVLTEHKIVSNEESNGDSFAASKTISIVTVVPVTYNMRERVAYTRHKVIKVIHKNKRFLLHDVGSYTIPIPKKNMSLFEFLALNDFDGEVLLHESELKPYDFGNK